MGDFSETGEGIQRKEKRKMGRDERKVTKNDLNTIYSQNYYVSKIYTNFKKSSKILSLQAKWRTFCKVRQTNASTTNSVSSAEAKTRHNECSQ